ncbi:hypothetical protein [Adhaeribacter pallidiroseus]|uniref:hypothetical protein n=1 Tax=Adhaeribacter pallidiroseus TaxID=2072847 RepID=UPI001314C724|nr:hypothetical protein [Adhaeribacter pallidiroseus]
MNSRTKLCAVGRGTGMIFTIIGGESGKRKFANKTPQQQQKFLKLPLSLTGFPAI